MKTQPIKANIENKKTPIFELVSNPFLTPKKPPKVEDMPDANLHFLKRLHIHF